MLRLARAPSHLEVAGDHLWGAKGAVVSTCMPRWPALRRAVVSTCMPPGPRSIASAPRARLLTWLSEAQSMPQDSLRVTICIVPIKKSTYAFGSSESRALW
jgi:hypothetical protein